MLRMLQEDEGLFDLYRIASGGRIHYWDTRAWRMPATALHRLYLEEQYLSGELLDLIAERQRLVPRISYARRTVDSVRSWLRTTEGQGAAVKPFTLLSEEEEDDAPGAVDPACIADDTGRWALEHHELELRTIEDQEIDLIQRTELVRDKIRRARRVLSSQSEIAAAAMARRQRRLHAMSGGGGDEERKRRRITAAEDGP